MTSVQNQKLNQSLSFEDVSKLFALPLTEAADILGVSTSDLKKLCNDNGLQRWPHRKYLAGKSIDDIKNEAAKEKSKALERQSQANKHKSTVTTGLGVSSSPGSHGKDKTVRYAIEISESEGNAQQQGSKTTLRPHQMLGSGLALDASAFSGEFKYGFPSDGLSRSSNKWWGSASDGKDELSNDESKTTSNVKDASEAQVENSLMVMEGRDQTDVTSLSAVRKRALDEGLKALKSGALKRYGADQLQKEEKILLRRIFQAS